MAEGDILNMKTLADRLDELMVLAAKRGILEQVHNYDVIQRIMAMADLLGYDRNLAIDPNIPLTFRL